MHWCDGEQLFCDIHVEECPLCGADVCDEHAQDHVECCLAEADRIEKQRRKDIDDKTRKAKERCELNRQQALQAKRDIAEQKKKDDDADTKAVKAIESVNDDSDDAVVKKKKKKKKKKQDDDDDP